MDEIDLKIKIMVERIMIILTVIIDMWIGRKQSFRYYYVFRQTDRQTDRQTSLCVCVCVCVCGQ